MWTLGCFRYSKPSVELRTFSSISKVNLRLFPAVKYWFIISEYSSINMFPFYHTYPSWSVNFSSIQMSTLGCFLYSKPAVELRNFSSIAKVNLRLFPAVKYLFRISEFFYSMPTLGCFLFFKPAVELRENPLQKCFPIYY